MHSKQVIVMRRLGVRRGKECAQAAHASMKWLTKRIREGNFNLSDSERDWVYGLFTKIVCIVDTEDELMAVYNKAKENGVIVEVVEDVGKTEFHGVTTRTAIAVGPDWADKVDEVTADLKLY